MTKINIRKATYAAYGRIIFNVIRINKQPVIIAQESGDKRDMKFYRLLPIIMVFTIGCDIDLFDYSINEATSEYSGEYFNKNNIQRLHKSNPSDNFTFAVISDTHSHYDDFLKAVKKISSNPEISFIIHAGDFTDSGLTFEYEKTVKILKQSSIPFFVVIGNHDLLANGKILFEDIFGPRNYSFSYGNTLFVMGDNNIWESNRSFFDNLDEALGAPSDIINRIIITHSPMDNIEKFGEAEVIRYKSNILKYKVDMSIHGHTHNYDYIPDFTECCQMIIVNALFKKSYSIIHINGDNVSTEQVDL